MGKISKKVIEETVKSEYEAIAKWKKQDNFRSGKMMIDTEDAEIWSDVFLDGNNFNVYKKDTIDELDCESDNVAKGFTEDVVRQIRSSCSMRFILS